jgi:hypothetical protein
MQAFVQGIVDVFTGLFSGLVEAFSNIGSFIFVMGENGTISGMSGFGWFLIVLIGVPLATWLLSKLFGLINRLINSKK